MNTPKSPAVIDLNMLATVTGGANDGATPKKDPPLGFKFDPKLGRNVFVGCPAGTEWSPSSASCAQADDGSQPFPGN